MAEASLTSGSLTLSGAARSYQEFLKTAVDRANNNLNFIQAPPAPGSITFG